MATYSALFDMAYSATDPLASTFTPLLKKTTVAVSSAAIAVLAESTGTTNHAARLIWAVASLKALLPYSQQMLWSVLQDSGIAATGDTSTDLAVQSAVNGLVNRYAF